MIQKSKASLGILPILRVPGTLINAALLAMISAPIHQLIPSTSRGYPQEKNAPDIVFADFEQETYTPWKVTGEAFGSGPARGSLPGQMAVGGFNGQGLVNSFFRLPEALTETMTHDSRLGPTHSYPTIASTIRSH